jgi:hypothetical protein
LRLEITCSWKREGGQQYELLGFAKVTSTSYAGEMSSATTFVNSDSRALSTIGPKRPSLVTKRRVRRLASAGGVVSARITRST